mmetsp:Transcript_11586/g.17526  ORF Transcript_11586/g.17526 Transcript_11586/m.17526 type:complete len:308 (+) Transcript_11586:1666-2589(+)
MTPEDVEVEIRKKYMQVESYNVINSLPWEVADVCFGKESMNEVMYLQNMTTLRNEFLKVSIKISRSKNDLQKEKLALEQQKYRDLFEQEKERYFDKFPRGGNDQEKAEDDSGDPEVRYAYVVFRNMDATEMALKAYTIGTCKRKCIMSCFGNCCCLKARKKLERKHFFSSWPRINRACMPDNIKWENLGYTAKERNTRSAIAWLIALVLILVSIIGIVILKNKTDELKKEFNTDIQCPENSISIKEQAYDDYTLPEEQRRGFMHCYCLAYALEGGLDILNHNFTEFPPIEGAEDTLYCKDWMTNYAI